MTPSDKLNAALRALILNGGTPQSDRLPGYLLTAEYDTDVPIPRKAKLLEALASALHSGPTLGVLLQQQMQDRTLSPTTLATQLDCPTEVMDALVTDTIYPSSVPLLLMKKLLQHLDITFKTAQEAIYQTLQALDDTRRVAGNSLGMSFRKSGTTEQGTSSQLTGRELFENNETLQKYLSRLKDLMGE